MALALHRSVAPVRGQEGAMGIDPVCKSEVNPMGAEAQSEYDGVVFYFCSHACKEQFDREPLRYLDDVDLAEIRAKQAAGRAA
jgi:YHS domain-containing protein